MIENIKTMKQLGVYIHWPFCESKCPYCDFNSHVTKEEINENIWFNGYIKQLNYFLSYMDIDKYEVKSIFFGGGTPSLMNPLTVGKIISYIKNNIKISKTVEITLESNPSSAEREKFLHLKELGINRLSIGVQALNDTDLIWLGRKHNTYEALRTIQMARSIFENYSFDLIYGRRNQTPESWEQELLLAMNLAAKHISIYSLTLEEGTKFTKMFQKGKLEIPSIDIYEDLYELTNSFLTKHHFNRYETSNYAKDGFECKHNTIYWQTQDYIGIGPGAHGRITLKSQERFETIAIKQPSTWINSLTNNDPIKIGNKFSEITDLDMVSNGIKVFNKISHENQIKEILIMGLRLKTGIDIQDIKARTSINLIEEIKQQTLEKLVKQDMITISNDHIITTEKGMNFVDNIVLQLFQ